MKKLKRLLPVALLCIVALVSIFLVACSKETATYYTVTFGSNGGSAVESQQVKSGETATEPTDPTRSGYEFDGWYLLDGTEYVFSTKVTSDVTLVAKWTQTYTITFNTNGGSSVASQTVKNGGTVTKPNDPTKSGYEFAGWYLNDIEYNFAYAVASNITLEAKWTQLFTVTFNSNGGTAVAAQIVRNGESVSEPEAIVRDGYEFNGWYLNGLAYDFASAVEDDITLDAQWLPVMMLKTVTVNADAVEKNYNIGDEISIDDIIGKVTISATLVVYDSTTTKTIPVAPDSEAVTVDLSEYDKTSAGTYTIYVGYTYGGITRWDSFQVTVSSVISGVHGIEIQKTTTEYNVKTDDNGEVVTVNLDDIKVYLANSDGTLGDEITEGVTFKYFLGATEIEASQMTNQNVNTYQIWAYVTYIEGNETYTMSDFVFVDIIGDEIYELSLDTGTTKQEQSYTTSIGSDWVLSATFSLTGVKRIDLSNATVGTQAGQYTIENLYTSVVGGGVAKVTYYYAVGSEIFSYECSVPYEITPATSESTFYALVDVSVSSNTDQVDATPTVTIGAISDGYEIVANMIYVNGSLSSSTENKTGANGEGKLYDRVQFSTTKGLTLYLAGPATITLYARYGSSSGEGGTFQLKDAAGNIVSSATIANSKNYEAVTVTADVQGVYTLFATASLNTFRFSVSGKIIPVSSSLNVNSLAEADVASYTENKTIGDFEIIAASGSEVDITDKSAEPVDVCGWKFTKAIELKGSKKGSGNARSIKLVITEDMLANGSVYVTVFANHGGGASVDRTLGLYADGASGSNYTDSATVAGSGAIAQYVVTTAGTYYLGSQSSGINVYYIGIGYSTAAQEVD